MRLEFRGCVVFLHAAAALCVLEQESHGIDPAMDPVLMGPLTTLGFVAAATVHASKRCGRLVDM